MPTSPRRWSVQEVQDLGLSTDVPTAASILGISPSTAYDLIVRDEFPVPVLRVGRRRIVVPTKPLLDALHGEGTQA